MPRVSRENVNSCGTPSLPTEPFLDPQAPLIDFIEPHKSITNPIVVSMIICHSPQNPMLPHPGQTQGHRAGFIPLVPNLTTGAPII